MDICRKILDIRLDDTFSFYHYFLFLHWRKDLLKEELKSRNDMKANFRVFFRHINFRK